MKKWHIFLSILLVMGFALMLTAQVGAQEPADPSTRGKHTPTPIPQPTGTPIRPQIVGGNLASPAEYKWQVAIVRATLSTSNGQFCGGSLIHTEWVLTAAHCMVRLGLLTRPADINVVVGINNLSSNPPSGQRIAVDKVIPFPGYNETTLDRDLALLHLTTPATLNATVQTIGLAGPGDSALFEPGDTATVTGWGATSEGGAGSDALLEVSIPIVSNASCNAPSSYNGKITDNMLCAGLPGGGKDSCQGDSGGPMIVPNGLGWLQAGVVSWGEGCAQPNFYGVYSRVSQFKSWIDLQINGLSGAGLQKVYLPIVIKSPTTCTPAAPGESSNFSNARTICSGQIVSGQVSRPTDLHDVYKISVASGQRLTISMSGTGGDADLFLFPPGSTSLSSGWAALSEHDGNTESLDVTVFTAGTWYVDIYSFTGTTNYNFTVTLSSP